MVKRLPVHILSSPRLQLINSKHVNVKLFKAGWNSTIDGSYITSNPPRPVFQSNNVVRGKK
jgi:hypothetical protein